MSLTLPTPEQAAAFLAALYLIGRVGDFFSRLHVRLDPWSEA